MSIRPIDLNGMIQSTNEVQTQKSSEDARSTVQQSNLMVNSQAEADHKETSVQHNENATKKEFNPGEGGDGTGYMGNRGRKNNKEKDDSKKREDGFVKKTPYGSFDMKV